MRINTYDKLNNLLAEKMRREKEAEEFQKEIADLQESKKDANEAKAIAASIVSKHEHVRGVRIYKGIDGAVFLKEPERRL